MRIYRRFHPVLLFSFFLLALEEDVQSKLLLLLLVRVVIYAILLIRCLLKIQAFVNFRDTLQPVLYLEQYFIKLQKKQQQQQTIVLSCVSIC